QACERVSSTAKGWPRATVRVHRLSLRGLTRSSGGGSRPETSATTCSSVSRLTWVWAVPSRRASRSTRAWTERGSGPAATQVSAAERLVGCCEVGPGTTSTPGPESVDEALRVGGLDAVRRRRGDDSYTIRVARRRPGSIWSAVNVAKVEALVVAGRMTPAGL